MLFVNQEYNADNPWEGLFRSQLLVWVSILSAQSSLSSLDFTQAFKHIFTSPSSVEKKVKTT
jgi:hypothetical protein